MMLYCLQYEFGDGVRGAIFGSQEGSGILALVFDFICGWEYRGGLGVVAGIVVDVGVLYRFGMMVGAGFVSAFCFCNWIAAL